MVKYLYHLIALMYYKFLNRKRVKCSYSSSFHKDSFFEGMNKIYEKSFFKGYLGYGSYIGPHSIINGKIGRFTSIAPQVVINHGIHPMYPPYVSTSPMFYSTQRQNGGTFVNYQKFDEYKFADMENKYPVIIGNDCWIGERVFINGGIRISDGAVVLAHSVVTKDIPPYAIVGGVPAKVIKYRYDEEIIKFLLRTQWWENEIYWIEENAVLFCDIEKFKSIIELKEANY